MIYMVFIPVYMMRSFVSQQMVALGMQMKHKKGEENTEQEEEEHTVSVISNLFQGLSRGSRRDRVAAKFVENEFEKCDRLIELYNRYLTKVIAEQVRLAWLHYWWTMSRSSHSQSKVMLRSRSRLPPTQVSAE